MLAILNKNGAQVMSSVELSKLCVGEKKDSHANFMKKAEKVLGSGVVNFYDTYKSAQGKQLKCLMLPEREACLMAMSYSYELQAKVFDAWRAGQVRELSTKELLLMSLQAIEEKEQALALVEHKQQKIDTLENLFHDGGTIPQFCKQLNGVNVQQVNWALEGKWLYKKDNLWRVASAARDKYLTEKEITVCKQGREPITTYKVTLLKAGKARLHEMYLSNKLPMKKSWDRVFTHEL